MGLRPAGCGDVTSSCFCCNCISKGRPSLTLALCHVEFLREFVMVVGGYHGRASAGANADAGIGGVGADGGGPGGAVDASGSGRIVNALIQMLCGIS